MDSQPAAEANEEGGENNNQQQQVQRIFKSKQLEQISLWDDHKIGIDNLCKRFGFRSDYFLKVGMTLEYVDFYHKTFGKNEITNYI